MLHPRDMMHVFSTFWVRGEPLQKKSFSRAMEKLDVNKSLVDPVANASVTNVIFFLYGLTSTCFVKRFGFSK